jgi:transcriptional regulator with XRE-family HTH domain
MLKRITNVLDNRDKLAKKFRNIKAKMNNSADYDASYFVDEGEILPYRHIIYIYTSNKFLFNVYSRIDTEYFSAVLKNIILEALSYADIHLKAQKIVIGSIITPNKNYIELCNPTIVDAVKLYMRRENPYLDVKIAVLPERHTENIPHDEPQHEKAVYDLIQEENPLRIKTYVEFEKRLEEKIRQSGKSREQYLNLVRYTYMLRYDGSVEEFAEAVGSNKSTLSRIRSGYTRKPNKTLVLAMGLALKLSLEEFYIFVHANNRKFPEDMRDIFIENAIRSGNMTYDEIRAAIRLLNPDNPLITPEDEFV